MPNTNDERIAVNVSLPKSLDRAVEMEAVRLDIPKRQLIEDALRARLSGKEKVA